MEKSLVQKMIQKYGERVRFLRLDEKDDNYFQHKRVCSGDEDDDVPAFYNLEELHESRLREERRKLLPFEEAERDRIEEFLENLRTGKYKSDWDD